MDGALRRQLMERRDISHLCMFLHSFLQIPPILNGQNLYTFTLLHIRLFVLFGKIWLLHNVDHSWNLRILVQVIDRGSSDWKRLFIERVLCACPYQCFNNPISHLLLLKVYFEIYFSCRNRVIKEDIWLVCTLYVQTRRFDYSKGCRRYLKRDWIIVVLEGSRNAVIWK